MSYYDTIEEDLERAKAILKAGKADAPFIGGQGLEFCNGGGTIYGKDTYAAYKLLESFVAEIERLRELEFRLQLSEKRRAKKPDKRVTAKRFLSPEARKAISLRVKEAHAKKRARKSPHKHGA